MYLTSKKFILIWLMYRKVVMTSHSLKWVAGCLFFFFLVFFLVSSNGSGSWQESQGEALSFLCSFYPGGDCGMGLKNVVHNECSLSGRILGYRET